MARARRICPKPGCPQTAVKRYCTEHEREYERARGNSNQRGYGKEYQAERRRWKPKVDAGLVRCWRCDQLIHPGTAWHLGHDDNDRSIIQGPEHPSCNLSAAGKAAHRYQ